MNADLAKAFLLEFLPPEAQIPVAEVFSMIRENPSQVLSHGFIYTQLHYLKSDNKPLAVACANGVITGFALASCMRYPEVERMMSEYLAIRSKERGENVVNFLAKKGT